MLIRKRSGATEPFSRVKVVSGVRKACQGRPVGEDALALLGHVYTPVNCRSDAGRRRLDRALVE